MGQAYGKVTEAVENTLIKADFLAKEGLRNMKKSLSEERGSMVEYIIIIAVVASVAVIVMGVLSRAISDKGNQAADLINNATF